MIDLQALIDMGGYAAYIWPAYGLGAALMVLVLVVSLRAARTAERELALLQQTRRARRGARPEANP